MSIVNFGPHLRFSVDPFLSQSAVVPPIRCGPIRITEALMALNLTERRLFFSVISGLSGSVVQDSPFLSQSAVVPPIAAAPFESLKH